MLDWVVLLEKTLNQKDDEIRELKVNTASWLTGHQLNSSVTRTNLVSCGVRRGARRKSTRTAR